MPTNSRKVAPDVISRFPVRGRICVSVLLFDALATSWGCNCASFHYANLLLEDVVKSGQVQDNSQGGEEIIYFKLWFSFGLRPEDTVEIPWYWQHVKVRTVMKCVSQEAIMSNDPAAIPV